MDDTLGPDPNGGAAAVVVRAPARRGVERAWVCATLFERWLGLPVRIEPSAGDEVSVQLWLAGELRGEVVWADHFFAQADARWRSAGSGPPLPLPMWRLPQDAADLAQRIGEPALAQPFGDGRFERSAGRIRLPIDITGCAFFMLSRYEEAVEGAPADRHGRFPGRASAAQSRETLRSSPSPCNA